MDTESWDAEITAKRLDELMRWHGKDESALPPASTLQNLSRDTVAALRQLHEARTTIEQLRTAMGRAFWVRDAQQLRRTLLVALGPPPAADDVSMPSEAPSTSSPSSDPRLAD